MKILSCVVVALLVLFTLGGCCCPAPAPTSSIEDPGPLTELPPAPAKRTAESFLTPDQKIEAALAKKRVKGLDWEEMNLDAAVTYLQTITGHKFHISPKVREEKFDDIVINAQLDDVSVKTLLDNVLTEPFELRWEVRKGVIWILTKEELGGKVRLRYFDVKDLVPSSELFTGTRVGDAPARAPDGSKSTDALVDEIRQEVHPTYWDRKDVTIEARNGILIVRASPAVHDAIDEFLAAERGRQDATDAGKALKAKFAETQVNVSVKGETLGGVLRMLQITTGFNLMIDSRSVGEVERNPISGLQLKDVSLTTALTMLAASAGEAYVWVYRDNVAVLTHKEHVR